MADANPTSASPQRPFWMPDAQGFVAGSIIIIAAVVLFYRMTHPTTVDDKVLDMMLTILFGTALVAIINFLFGSSRSSQAKDDTLATLATAPVTPPTVTNIAPAPLTPPAPPPQQNP